MKGRCRDDSRRPGNEPIKWEVDRSYAAPLIGVSLAQAAKFVDATKWATDMSSVNSCRQRCCGWHPNPHFSPLRVAVPFHGPLDSAPLLL